MFQEKDKYHIKVKSYKQEIENSKLKYFMFFGLCKTRIIIQLL